MGMRTLAVYINDLGARSKRGNGFTNKTVSYILNNPVYIGKARWTPTGKAKFNFNHPDSIIAPGQHEAIISEELWEKAQEVIKENKEMFPQRVRSDSKKVTWLHGLVHCGTCDKKLVRSSHEYLICNGYSKGQCKTTNSIKYPILEALVLESLKKDYTSPIELNITPKRSDTVSTHEHELINKQLEAFTGKLERIKTAYQDGIDTLEEYKENKNFVDSERERLYTRLTELKETLLNADEQQTMEKRLKDVHDLLTDDTIDFEIKYQTVNFLISKITYDKKAKTLKLQYKY
jgi:Trp operon repressor